MLCHVHHAVIHNISDQEYLSVFSGTNCTKRELKITICIPAVHLHTCSSVNVVTLLQAGHPRDHTLIPGGAWNILLLPSIWSNTRAHPTLWSMGTAGSVCFQQLVHDSDLSPHLVPRLRVTGASPPLLLFALMACTRTALLTHCGFAAQIYSIVTSNYSLSASFIFVMCCGFQVLCDVLY